MLKVLLINDTEYWYHYGCTATSLALKEGIRRLGYALTSRSIKDTYKIDSIPTTLEGFESYSVFEAFNVANPDLMEAMRANDILVVNGEGTIHGARSGPLSLLYVAFIAKKFLGKHVEIINHSAYPEDGLETTTAIYRLVYNTLDFTAIREPESLAVMQPLIKSGEITESFDCMPLYIKHRYKLHHQKEKTLLISGSAAWLNLKNLRDRGDMSAFYDGISELVRYLNVMSEQGYQVQFLFGAEADPSRDDEEMIAFIRDPNRAGTKLEFQLKTLVAHSVDEWLAHIERSSMLVSGRFHHSIAAACLGTAFIVLESNTPKVYGLAQLLPMVTNIIKFDASTIFDLLLGNTRRLEAGLAISNEEARKSLLAHLCDDALQNFKGLLSMQEPAVLTEKLIEIQDFFVIKDPWLPPPEQRELVIALHDKISAWHDPLSSSPTVEGHSSEFSQLSIDELAILSKFLLDDPESLSYGIETSDPSYHSPSSYAPGPNINGDLGNAPAADSGFSGTLMPGSANDTAVTS